MTETRDAPIAYLISTPSASASAGTITTPPPRPVSAPRKPATADMANTTNVKVNAVMNGGGSPQGSASEEVTWSFYLLCVSAQHRFASVLMHNCHLHGTERRCREAHRGGLGGDRYSGLARYSIAGGLRQLESGFRCQWY